MTESPDDAETLVGAVLGNWRLIQKLGAGGMGAVYVAEHRRIPRKAAIKLLLPQLSANPAFVERFFNEARAASVIAHPGIVEVLDCDVHDGRAYIVMELLRGQSLRGRLSERRFGPGDLPLLETVGFKVSEALAVAHERGIVHRDLKPDNIFLATDDHGLASAVPTVKVLDFGIAKLAMEGAPSQTSTGALMGSPAYMSPEQCRGAGRVDFRTDIYSLGCVLFEMAAGRTPFVGEGAGELIAAHLTQPPPHPSMFAPWLPSELDALIVSMLSKDPQVRPASMSVLAATLASGRPKAAETLALPSGVPQTGGTLLLASGDHAPTGARTTFASAAGEQTFQSERTGSRRAVWGVALLVALVASVVIVLVDRKSGRSERENPPVSTEKVVPVGATPAAPATISITLAGLPPNAEILIDGRPAANPVLLPVSHDSRQVRVRADKHRPLTFVVVPTKDQIIDVAMQPEETAATSSSTAARTTPPSRGSSRKERSARGADTQPSAGSPRFKGFGDI